MHSLYQIVIISLLCLTIFADPKKLEKQAKKFNCDPAQKISLENKVLAQCNCVDKSICIWNLQTGDVLTGCTCKPPPTKDYNCLETAIINGCGDTKIECNTAFGQCQCPNGNNCAWIGKKSIGGCPCGSNYQSGGFNTDQKPKPPKKDKKKQNIETVDL